ncbi:hypothetical protein ACFFIS_06270 [Virgibacillus soli]|uniref:Uncharacterized protein n=1 Tax=Paracerasibacillus soli TaxID=480284 RepID=A0ABU5CVG1_9BACI|nr:hypothetical protein [Virgibacillus soli]MDY0409799.1 hypothetical protein [Virgibacillus soli]
MLNFFKKAKKNDDCCKIKIEEVKKEKKSCCNVKIEEVSETENHNDLKLNAESSCCSSKTE